MRNLSTFVDRKGPFEIHDKYKKNSHLDPRKVPKESEDLKKVASYRTKNRFPVLSWVHPETGAALIRSSQPTVGINDKVRMERATIFFSISIFRKTKPISNI